MLDLKLLFLNKNKISKFKLFKFFKKRAKNKPFINKWFVYNTEIRQNKKKRRFFKRRLRIKEIKDRYKLYNQKRNYK